MLESLSDGKPATEWYHAKKSFEKETNNLDLRMKLARTGGDPRVGLWEEAESSSGETPGKQEG